MNAVPGPHPDASERTELIPASPVCERCFAPALAQWQRRLTEVELGVELAREQQRREQAYVLRDLQLPDPVFGPMPTTADYTRAVYACGDHAIDQDDATLVHQADCTGPHGDLDPHPQCSCEPEPLPMAEPDAVSPAPAHWG